MKKDFIQFRKKNNVKKHSHQDKLLRINLQDEF
jgi:hypothetical protein